jgi:hypothetical protein
LSHESLFWVDFRDLDAYTNGGERVLDVSTATNCGVEVSHKKLHQVVQCIYLPERVMNLLSRLWLVVAPTSSDTSERTVAQLLCRQDVRSEPEPLIVSLTSFTGGGNGTHNT